MTDPFHLNRIVRTIIADDIRRIDDRFGLGIVDAVEGSYASIRKGDPEAPATPGFFVPPDTHLVSGDNVFYMDDARLKLVMRVLSRNAIIPDALTLRDLTLTGRLVRNSVLNPPALTADTHNWAPDGLADAYIIRIDQTGGPWTLSGMLADPGVEHLLLNVSTGTLTLPHDDAGSVPANRWYAANNASLLVRKNGGVRVWYDDASDRWRTASP